MAGQGDISSRMRLVREGAERGRAQMSYTERMEHERRLRETTEKINNCDRLRCSNNNDCRKDVNGGENPCKKINKKHCKENKCVMGADDDIPEENELQRRLRERRERIEVAAAAAVGEGEGDGDGEGEGEDEGEGEGEDEGEGEGEDKGLIGSVLNWFGLGDGNKEDMKYYHKYMKYKTKYLKLKSQL